MSLLLRSSTLIRPAGLAPRAPRGGDAASLPIDRLAPHTAAAAAVAAPRRNAVIDVLRGYCIVMMIVSHAGTQTWVNSGVHMLRFVSGAEGFVFLSGLVLGMVTRSRIAAGGRRSAYAAIWRRAAKLWSVHSILTISAICANTWLLHFADLPTLREIGFARLIWLTATLRLQPGHMLNILPLYVFLVAAAPAALEAMRRGKTVWLLALSAGVFFFCQWQPGAGRWAHEISGGEAFPPLAWQALFVPGLCIGYHRDWLRQTVVGPHRRLLLWGFAGACALAAVIVSVQTPLFQFYNHEAWDLYLWERHPLRFGRVLYALVSIVAFYLLAQALPRRWRGWRLSMGVLATLGRSSLYAFLVHIPIAFAATSLRIPPDQWLLLELVPVASLIAVYLMTRYQVARRWIPN